MMAGTNALATVGGNAVVIDAASITWNEAGVRGKVAALIEPYVGTTPEGAAAMDKKQLKACRSELNAISRELNDARKVIKAEYLKPLQEFEAAIKSIDESIKQPAGIIDAAIKCKEETERAQRTAALEALYLETAPILAEAVPFERIFEKQWANASFGAKKAEDALADKILAVIDGLNDLQRMELHAPEEAKAVYFRTLSTKAAREHDDMRREEDARIARMEAEREANRAAQAAAPQAEAKTATYEESAAVAPAASVPAVEPREVYTLTIRCTASEFAEVRKAIDALGTVEKISCTKRRA